jgi:hypothetical protein
MSVKAFLAREEGDFVSLDEVLHGMVRANDCSYQEAAITLLRLMVRDDWPPTWLFKSAVDGVTAVQRDHPVAMKLLRAAAREGEPFEEIPF